MVNDVSFPKRKSPMGEATGARSKAQLGKEAIRSALNGEWEQAVAVNRQILDICPTDCEASNRLAKAQMELGDYSDARRTLEQLTLHAPSNVIARKNLARLDQLQNRSAEARTPPVAPGKSPGMFIAESGKSCTTTLCRQAGPSELAPVAAGDAVTLNPAKDGVTVSSLDGRYLGALQRRLGRRVNRLMAGGNKYDAAVVGIEESGISVILRETVQSPTLRHVVSFPAQVSAIPGAAPAAEGISYSVPPVDEAEANSLDPADSDDAIDPADAMAIDLPDDASLESEGPDEVPTLETDDDPGLWSPLATGSQDEDDWD